MIEQQVSGRASATYDTRLHTLIVNSHEIKNIKKIKTNKKKITDMAAGNWMAYEEWERRRKYDTILCCTTIKPTRAGR